MNLACSLIYIRYCSRLFGRTAVCLPKQKDSDQQRADRQQSTDEAKTKPAEIIKNKDNTLTTIANKLIEKLPGDGKAG